MSTYLSEEAWAEVERLYRSGASAKMLAKRYGIQPGTIHSRSCNEKWRLTRVRAAAPSKIERLESVAARLESVALKLAEVAK
ncbi:hypothetical protein PQQ99_09730 [Paraburkholderia sediminicola]|uniref:hypothetical protein n=1 Tax=Paraburkholderia sediminicola TaxID=458836 RepID=UPI0038BC580D